MVAENGATQVFIQKVPKIDVVNNPFIENILPLKEDIDAIARTLDEFYFIQDPSFSAGEFTT